MRGVLRAYNPQVPSGKGVLCLVSYLTVRTIYKLDNVIVNLKEGVGYENSRPKRKGWS